MCFFIVTVWPPADLISFNRSSLGSDCSLYHGKEMREPERQKWIHGGKAGRKENDVNKKCRERIHDKISFVVVVVVVCLFSFKFHRLLGWQKLNRLTHSQILIFQRLCKMLPSRVVFRHGVGAPVAKQLSLTISFHTETRNQQGWGHSKHAQLKYILHFIITHS